MRSNAFLLALGAGLISAVVFASATTGPLLMRCVLFFLTPLSLYLTGLGLGVVPVAIAAIVAIACVLLMAGGMPAFAYGISVALPAVYLSRLTLLSRTEDDKVVWYPLGSIILWAALFAALFATVAIVLMGADLDTLRKMIRGVVESFAKNELAEIPGAPKFDAAKIDEIANTTVQSLPSALAMLSLSTILLNLWLAARVTLASGRLMRPWPDLAMLSLPPAATFGLALALGATFIGGMMGLFSSAFAAPLVAAFALVGLATAHYLTRGSPWRGFMLVALYAGAYVLPPVLPILVIAGLAETIFHYRATHQSPPTHST